MDASDRLEFAPPRQDAMRRGFALAVLVHALLVAGLASGLKWQRETQSVAVEAELWSALPREAAPPPPPPPPPPAPAPVPAPPPPAVRAPPRPDPQVQREAQIALEREKKRELEKEKQAQLQHEREERRKLEAKKKREEELARKKEEARQQAREQAQQAKEKAKEQARQLAEAKRKEEDKKRKELEAREARDSKRVAQLREENLRRIQGMAGTGAPSAAGAHERSSGPSAGWGARVNARVRPNIVFSDVVTGNPEAVVEVRLAPDGTIVSRRIKKSSGSKSWDEAVLRALDKTEMLPRDTDGSVPPGGELVFRPKG